MKKSAIDFYTNVDPDSIDGEACYLLHFDVKVGDHAQHYLGTTKHLSLRLRTHATKPDAKLLAELKRLGGSFVVVKLWAGGYDLERKLKSRKNAPKLCPICEAKRLAELNK